MCQWDYHDQQHSIARVVDAEGAPSWRRQIVFPAPLSPMSLPSLVRRGVRPVLAPSVILVNDEDVAGEDVLARVPCRTGVGARVGRIFNIILIRIIRNTWSSQV